MNATRTAHAWATVRRYLGEDVTRYLRHEGVQIVALNKGEAYSAASGELSRLDINLDAWPTPPAGLFVVEEKTVYLRSVSAMTVVHETAHALDCVLGGGIYLSGTDAAFRAAFASDPAFVTPYAAAGADEAFAEGIRALVEANDSQSFWPDATRARLYASSPAMAVYLEHALALAQERGRALAGVSAMVDAGDGENAPDVCPEHGPHNEDYCPGCIDRREHAKTCPIAGAARELASYVLYDDSLVDVDLCPEKSAAVARMEALAHALAAMTEDGVPVYSALIYPGGGGYEDHGVIAALDASELATVLDALRSWQQHGIQDPGYFGADNTRALTEGEVDDLCERLNTSPRSIKIALWVEGGVLSEARSNCPPGWFDVSTYDDDFVKDGDLNDDQLADQQAARERFESLPEASIV